MSTEVLDQSVPSEINKYDFRTESKAFFKARKGIDPEIVTQISEMKGEPDWMREFRLHSLEIFNSKPMPRWGGKIDLNFQDIFYYLKPTDHQGRSWDDVPEEIKKTFDRLGIPEAEKKYLSGVKAQFESEVIYGSLKEDLAKQGVIFTDTDTAIREYPDLVREYFATIIPPADNKFAALNSAVWSGGSFIYVPKGVKIEFPLQAYFRINAESMGQFERHADHRRRRGPGALRRRLHRADVHHRKLALGRGGNRREEACPLPVHHDSELGQQHLQPGHQTGLGLRRRADGMDRRQPRQPADDEVSVGLHDGARRAGEILSIAFASHGQHQDAGAKLVHCAPDTSGRIISKSISKNGGRASYRGLVKVERGAKRSKSNVVCDALILDPNSRSDTYPYIEVDEQNVQLGHEASVSRISEEQLFYLQSRGLSEAEASTMIVSGFIEPLVKELPMEYAVEMNRLIELQMEGSVG